MRLSSSSLVMANASTSCSVRSEKFFTRAALCNRWLKRTHTYIRTDPNRNGCARSPLLPPAKASKGRVEPETCEVPDAVPPQARAGDSPPDAALLSVRPRRDPGRARLGDRRAGPRFPGQALLRGRLAHAGRRGRDRRDHAERTDA